MNFGKSDHPCACLIVGSVREADDGLFCGGGQAHESPGLLACNGLFFRAVFTFRSAAELGENLLRKHARAADLYSLPH